MYISGLQSLGGIPEIHPLITSIQVLPITAHEVGGIITLHVHASISPVSDWYIMS